MSGKVDSVCDDSGSGVGHGGTVGEYGDCVSNAKGEAASAPAAGGDTAHGLGGFKESRTEEGSAFGDVDHSSDEVAALKMQRDVTAVIDVGSIEVGGVCHCRENLFSDG